MRRHAITIQQPLTVRGNEVVRLWIGLWGLIRTEPWYWLNLSPWSGDEIVRPCYWVLGDFVRTEPCFGSTLSPWLGAEVVRSRNGLWGISGPRRAYWLEPPTVINGRGCSSSQWVLGDFVRTEPCFGSTLSPWLCGEVVRPWMGSHIHCVYWGGWPLSNGQSDGYWPAAWVGCFSLADEAPCHCCVGVMRSFLSNRLRFHQEGSRDTLPRCGRVAVLPYSSLACCEETMVECRLVLQAVSSCGHII